MPNLLFNLNTQEHHTVNLLCNAFDKNKKLQYLVGRSSTKFIDRLNKLLKYCIAKVKNSGGVFLSNNKNACIVYYRKSQLKTTFQDIIRQLYISLFVIGIYRSIRMLKHENKIKSIRNDHCTTNFEQDYIYIWFLAQIGNEDAIKSLLEIREFLYHLSEKIALPIYMETSNPRLIRFYERVGFLFYDEFIDPISNLRVHFAYLPPKDNLDTSR